MTAFLGDHTGCWRFETTLPLGFDLHWFREITPGQFRGASTIRVHGAGRVSVRGALQGTLRFDVAGEPAGHTRVRLFAARPPAVSARAETVTMSPATRIGVNPLLDALLSVHLIDWIRDALRLVGGVRWKQVADLAGVPYDAMLRLFEQWRALSASQEAALLQCVGSDPALDALRRVSRAVENEESSPADLTALLHRFLREEPGFVPSPAALWLDAAGCLPLGFNQSAASLAAVRAAARPLRRILEDGEVFGLLLRLPALAVEELAQGEGDSWVQGRLRCYCLSDETDEVLPVFSSLPGRVAQAAPDALNQELSGSWAALLAAAPPHVPLVDVSIPSGPEAAAALKRLAEGDLAPLLGSFGNTVFRYGLLTHQFTFPRTIPLRLPFLLRGELKNVLRFIPSALVGAAPEGGIDVHLERYPNGVVRQGRICPAATILKSAFTLRDGTPRDDIDLVRFTDRRPLKAGPAPLLWRQALAAFGIRAPHPLPEPVTATLTVTLPPETLLGWTETPHSKDPEFLAVFARISRALQSATRIWFPLMYFADSANFRPTGHALCLLAYQHTQPYALRRRGEFGYDALDFNAVRRALETAERVLPAAVSAVRRRLIAEGDYRTAELYEAEKPGYFFEAVWHRRRPFVDLLTADNRFLEEILQFGECCREVRAMTAHNQHQAIRKMAKFTTGFVRSFEGRLAGFYNRFDFSALSPLLFVEATRALHPGVRTPVEARLDLETPDGTRTWPCEHSFCQTNPIQAPSPSACGADTPQSQGRGPSNKDGPR
jgi:hypothetical protein